MEEYVKTAILAVCDGMKDAHDCGDHASLAALGESLAKLLEVTGFHIPRTRS